MSCPGRFDELGRAVALAALLAVAPARAQDPLLGETRLDLVRGPLLTSSRIMGLAGAFVAVAEGIDGVHLNPAAFANRPARSTSFFDVDVAFDWLFVAGDSVDLDGDGRSLDESVDFEAFTVGLTMQLGPFGAGLLATNYGWASPGFSLHHTELSAGIGWAFADGALIVGLAAVIDTLDVEDGTRALELAGASADLGVLYRPPRADWRLGARLKSTSALSDESGDNRGAGIVPWQIAVGWSYLLGADRDHGDQSAGAPPPAVRYNPALRAPYTPPVDRRYLLVATELVLLGVAPGQTLEGLVGHETRISGRHLSLGVHLGAEGEVFHNRMRARVGTYFEPVRVAAVAPFRPHMTGGLEVRLFELLFDWKANLAFDIAPGWTNFTVGVGFWK